MPLLKRVGLLTAFLMVFQVAAHAAGGDDSEPLRDGWKSSVTIPEKLWGEAGRYVIWVEGGWLQVRRESTGGETDWHIVLAQATDPNPPKITAPPKPTGRLAKGKSCFEVSYRGGRYFVREDFFTLRTVRERKPPQDEGWPAARLNGQNPEMGYAGTASGSKLLGGLAEPWYIIASAPNGKKYDCELRLTPTWRMRKGGGYGFQAYGAMIRAFAGNYEALDDGELLVAMRGPAGDPPVDVAIGSLAPKMVTKTLDGAPLNLADYRGKYVLLDFWATWCAPCVAEIPHLKEVHDTFGKDNRFAMISLTLDDDVKAPKAFLKKRDLPWTQAFVGDEAGSVVLKDYGVEAVPAIFLIGPGGKVIARDMRGEGIKEAVAKALATGDPVQPTKVRTADPTIR